MIGKVGSDTRSNSNIMKGTNLHFIVKRYTAFRQSAVQADAAFNNRLADAVVWEEALTLFGSARRITRWTAAGLRRNIKSQNQTRKCQQLSSFVPESVLMGVFDFQSLGHPHYL